jgi:hypothetical protein
MKKLNEEQNMNGRRTSSIYSFLTGRILQSSKLQKYMLSSTNPIAGSTPSSCSIQPLSYPSFAIAYSELTPTPLKSSPLPQSSSQSRLQNLKAASLRTEKQEFNSFTSQFIGGNSRKSNNATKATTNPCQAQNTSSMCTVGNMYNIFN